MNLHLLTEPSFPLVPTESMVQDTCVYVSKPSGGKDVSKNVERKSVCFYCLDPGHMISDCRLGNVKRQNLVLYSVSSDRLCVSG